MTSAVLSHSDESTCVQASPAEVGGAGAVQQRCDVLGVGISAVNLDLATATIDGWIRCGDRQYVCITGVHGVMESQADEALREIHNKAGMVTPDGMPMVWLNRLAGNGHVRRVYGPDLMLKVCSEGLAKGYRHYFYGGGEGVAKLLASRLTERFPGLQVAGIFCPPFRAMTEEEDRQLVAEIDAAKPDIIWVGLSTPKQEYWMSRHVGRVAAPVMIGVGAAFDFHAGLKTQAPRWMQVSGLEWLYRLLTEPKRLWKRYLKNNPLFVSYLVLNKLGLRKRRIAD